jgi:GTP-binding protein Era
MNPVCGFVSLVGEPNVGKSTLLNRLVGEPLAIVSPKPQTTWNTVRGILTAEAGQIIFVDTPGLHAPQDLCGAHMVASAKRALHESDLIYWLADCRRGAAAPPQFDAGLVASVPSFLVLNKVDLIAKPALLPLIEYFVKLAPFREVVPVSAKTGTNVDRLLQATWSHLPEGPPLFPADQLSDQPERDLVREFIREQMYLLTRQEIPYASAVTIEEYLEGEDRRKLLIAATIHVERDSQKGIVVGKGGEMIKKIGTAARGRIERFLGRPVFLDLRVKVREKWRRNEASLREFGLGGGR